MINQRPLKLKFQHIHASRKYSSREIRVAAFGVAQNFNKTKRRLGTRNTRKRLHYLEEETPFSFDSLLASLYKCNRILSDCNVISQSSYFKCNQVVKESFTLGMTQVSREITEHYYSAKVTNYNIILRNY